MRRLKDDTASERAAPKAPQQAVIIPHDPVNEAAVIAAAAIDPDIRRRLVRRVRSDHFLVRENSIAWSALEEITRRALEVDSMVIEKLAGADVASYVMGLVEAAPEHTNVDWHVANLLWDSTRAIAARGPLSGFLEALRDPKADPDRVRALARSLAQSFDGHSDRKYLREPSALVRAQMLEIEKRTSGAAIYPYGVVGLDLYEDGVRRRMIPGASPGKMTVVTAVSGGGKSTFTAHIALGIAGFAHDRASNTFVVSDDYRSVFFGAWEMEAGISLELLACISLGWSRSELMEGRGKSITPSGRTLLEERMNLIASRIRFFDNPFWTEQVTAKPSNDRNLDLIHAYLADSGCEVFIADLWKRCLVDDAPSAEERALIRQQSMLGDLRMHGILLQQQRLKDVEMRVDKRPTRDGIKGSGAWVEVPDTVLALHRPAFWKRIDDDKLELFVLKQRYGKWPLGIEFDWDPELGQVWGGREIEYDRPGEQSDFDEKISTTVARKPQYAKRRA